MVRVLQQNIPSEYVSAYISNLQQMTFFLGNAVYGIAVYGSSTYGDAHLPYVRERYPFRLPHMQGGDIIEP